MTLVNRNRQAIEVAQATVVQNAGGSHLEGEFEYTPAGWRVSFQKVTFQELVQIVEAVRRIREV